MPLDETAEARTEESGRAELQADKGIPHERVREWLRCPAQRENIPLGWN